MNFITRLPILINWNDTNYDFDLVIVNWLIKMIYYKLIKIIIDALTLAKVILDLVIWHYSLSNLIVMDKSLLFISKF